MSLANWVLVVYASTAVIFWVLCWVTVRIGLSPRPNVEEVGYLLSGGVLPIINIILIWLLAKEIARHERVSYRTHDSEFEEKP